MSTLGAGPEAITLLRTKLHKPYVGEDIIPRPHLVKRLNRGLNRTLRVALICAPAGFGKTAFMGVLN